MMNTFKIFCLLTICWVSINNKSNAQQRVNADFLKGTTAWLTANYVTDLDYAFLDNQEIQVRSLAGGANGSMEFTVNYLSGSNIIVSLAELGNLSNAYYIELSGSSFTMQGLSSVGGSFSDGDQFRIERCENSILFFGPGDLVCHEISNVDNTKEMIARMEVISASKVGGNTPNIELVFPFLSPNCVRPREDYVVLKKKLDGAFHQVTSNKIKFRYDQDYAIVNNENDQVKYTIYDWKKTPLLTGVFNNNYGTNFHVISIPPSLLAADFYLLEVTGVQEHGLNKGESYYLKLKY